MKPSAALAPAVAALLLCGYVRAESEFPMDFERDAILLSGTWEFLREHGDRELWRPEVAGALGPWEEFEVPGTILPHRERDRNEKLECVWARRTFEADEAQAAGSAVLKWGHVRFGATAYVNGVEVGSHEPIGPHTILLQPGALRAGENELVLRIPGWAGLHKSSTNVPTVAVGADLFWGARTPAIPDDVWIEFYDRAYMKWILAMPDVEAGAVTLRVWLDSADGLPDAVELSASVRPAKGGDPVGSATVTVERTDGPVDVRVEVPDAKLWTPDSPHLYVAELTATAGGRPCDETRFRFGMREIAVVDGHYRLNGRPLWLRGSNLVHEWTWGGPFDAEVKRYIVDEARNMSLNCFRTHTLSPPTRWADVCDENGIMLLAEFSVTYNYVDVAFTPQEWDAFHGNVVTDATEWVTKLWNHPSVIMWVLTNEPRGDTDWEAGPYHDHVRALDPTRPCMRTGETERGTDSVIDMHTCGNYAWGPEGNMLQTVAHHAAHKDPERALSNTEYMNYFGPYEEQVARRLGDPKHPDHKLDFAECALEDTEAMRRLQYDCILPYMYAAWPRFRGNDWRPDFPTPMAAALHSSMAPVLASLDLFDRNFVAGRRVTTPLCLINELPEDVDATVDVYVTPRNPLCVPDEDALAAAVHHESMQITFAADTVETRELSWPVPEEPGAYYLAVVVRREGARPVVSQRPVRALADPNAEKLTRPIAVVGADPRLEDFLARHDAPYTKVSATGDWQAEVVLIWDAAALLLDEGAAMIMRDVAARGGRVVIAEPARWSNKWLADFEIGEARNCARVFAYPNADHPLLSGIDPECLKRWNGLPGTISEGCVRGPILEDARKILWADNQDTPVVVSLPVGEGEIVISLLQVKDRIDPDGDRYDPAAEQVLLKLLGD